MKRREREEERRERGKKIETAEMRDEDRKGELMVLFSHP